MSEATVTKPEVDSTAGFQPLSWWKAVLLALGAVGCFHAAYTPANPGPLALLIVGYVVCLAQLARLRTTRLAFYIGLLTGLACFAPQLAFFWTIFGPAAIALWTVLAFWIALFVALTHLALARFGAKRAVWLVPFLWTGLEYFRGELYFLKFAWLNVGFALADFQLFPFPLLGVYGIGFCVAAFATVWLILKLDFSKQFNLTNILLMLLFVLILAVLVLCSMVGSKGRSPNIRVAGVQLEFPNPSQIQQALDNLVAARTNVDLIVLSEYTLDGPPPQELKDWCREHQKFLIVGGKDPAPGGNFYNTAFVIGTNGEVVFKQVKSVPIQFFKDGLPAPEQQLWESPWGKIGICICYDLSYTRVTDELARQGAQLLIVPTMDVADWGRHQHELHARVAPVRAAEYGIPIFRLASSGISQGVSRGGGVVTSAPFPGDGEMIFFVTRLGQPASLPLDRWLAPLCVGVTGLFGLWLATNRLRRAKKRG
jgi:apolipoprotein N-acyltransferase